MYHVDLVMDKNKRVIDRFSVGEMIYPVLYGRKGKLEWFDFELTMSVPNTFYVILYSSKDNELFNRINLRSEEKDINLNYDLVEKSNKLFEFIGKTVENKNVLVFDITKISSKEIISKLEELEELSA